MELTPKELRLSYNGSLSSPYAKRLVMHMRGNVNPDGTKNRINHAQSLDFIAGRCHITVHDLLKLTKGQILRRLGYTRSYYHYTGNTLYPYCPLSLWSRNIIDS
jgi:hypothetical protein